MREVRDPRGSYDEGVVRFIVFLVVIGLPAFAANWVKLTTPDFTLYSDGNPKRARELMIDFERVRHFFQERSGVPDREPRPVRIVVFGSDGEYSHYRPSSAASAFYTHDENRDYIAMGELGTEHPEIAMHEYTHLSVEHSGVKLPLWLNEGWADVCSTLRPRGKDKAMVGDLIPGRVQTLQNSTWIPLASLDQIGHDSPMYNESNRAGIFYAESWALTHMLFLSPEYMKGFPQVIRSAAAGKSLAQTLEAVYGKSTAQVQSDLTQYLDRNRLYGAVFPINLKVEQEEPQTTGVDAFESGLVLADMLGAGHKFDEAAKAYAALAAKYPKRPELEASIASLDLHTGDVDGARAHFKAAIDDGSTDAAMCYRYAMLSMGADLLKDRIAALRRAIELKPDYTEAHLALGASLLDAKDYTGSIAELRNIHKITEENAVWYFGTLALDQAALGSLADAQKSAAEARKWAKSPEQIKRVDGLVEYLSHRQ